MQWKLVYLLYKNDLRNKIRKFVKLFHTKLSQLTIIANNSNKETSTIVDAYKLYERLTTINDYEKI